MFKVDENSTIDSIPFSEYHAFQNWMKDRSINPTFSVNYWNTPQKDAEKAIKKLYLKYLAHKEYLENKSK